MALPSLRATYVVSKPYAVITAGVPRTLIGKRGVTSWFAGSFPGRERQLRPEDVAIHRRPAPSSPIA